jgi:hypothetical protein
MSPQNADVFPAARPAVAFDPLTALDDLLSTVGLTRAATGGTVSISGRDPILPSAHRLGACIGIPIMTGAVAIRRRDAFELEEALTPRAFRHASYVSPGNG